MSTAISRIFPPFTWNLNLYSCWTARRRRVVVVVQLLLCTVCVCVWFDEKLEVVDGIQIQVNLVKNTRARARPHSRFWPASSWWSRALPMLLPVVAPVEELQLPKTRPACRTARRHYPNAIEVGLTIAIFTLRVSMLWISSLLLCRCIVTVIFVDIAGSWFKTSGQLAMKQSKQTSRYLLQSPENTNTQQETSRFNLQENTCRIQN